MGPPQPSMQNLSVLPENQAPSALGRTDKHVFIFCHFLKGFKRAPFFLPSLMKWPPEASSRGCAARSGNPCSPETLSAPFRAKGGGGFLGPCVFTAQRADSGKGPTLPDPRRPGGPCSSHTPGEAGLGVPEHDSECVRHPGVWAPVCCPSPLPAPSLSSPAHSPSISPTCHKW